MGEFKAQILGVLIVIAVFGTVLAGYKTLVNDTWDKVSNEIASEIESL